MGHYAACNEVHISAATGHNTQYNTTQNTTIQPYNTKYNNVHISAATGHNIPYNTIQHTEHNNTTQNTTLILNVHISAATKHNTKILQQYARANCLQSHRVNAA